ncbi:MAG TPA: head GIN domain-containing protein [Cyclobacteriaceae bacterium]|nr:head GIN domain-containing protein [Cyclobacteriaceae bacterium]
MKIACIILLAGFVSLAAVAQQSEVRTPGSFRGVKSSEAIDVYLKKGDKESVKVEITGGQLSEVITEISGGYLRIHMRESNGWGRNKRDVKVYVTYVNLDKLSASSASNMFSDGPIKFTTLDVHASSAANIEVSIDGGDVTVHASSAGDISLEGKAKSLRADASSAGEIDAYNLTVEGAEASASSAGTVKLNVSTSLEAHASSGGSIRYRGNPGKTNTDSSSGGSVKRSN